jgi:hypothetical protein
MINWWEVWLLEKWHPSSLSNRNHMAMPEFKERGRKEGELEGLQYSYRPLKWSWSLPDQEGASKKQPFPPRAEAKAQVWKDKEQHRMASTASKRKLAGQPPHRGPRSCGAGGSPNNWGECQRRASLTACHHHATLSTGQPQRGQKAVCYAHCGCEGQQVPKHPGWEQALWHW